ncbi:MAG: DUF3999 family protein [Cryomorphaceae bacterium]|nr:DUF3999 family protein [Cryomorphaceae bacterium]
MNLRSKLIAALALLASFGAMAQIEDFSYRRKLSGISDTWHRIELPDLMYEKMDNTLSDLRIYGIQNSDTIEAPYLLQRFDEETVTEFINFTTINQTHSKAGYFYTFALGTEVDVNHIYLRFAAENFDWRVTLEGSHDQQEWFAILDNYRILSLSNSSTNYKFTDLNFKATRYTYYRLKIPAALDPKFIDAQLAFESHRAGILKDYSTRKIATEHGKQTVFVIELDNAVPVSKIYLQPNVGFDFFRPIRIESLVDSTVTETKTFYNYRGLSNKTISSVAPCVFEFPQTITKQLRITIENGDNEHLSFSSIRIAGRPHQLVARFTSSADYHLYYGNGHANQANYDISYFADSIPSNLETLFLGNEELIEKAAKPEIKPLFSNSYWLWAVLIIVIALLGWFTMKMMRN